MKSRGRDYWAGMHTITLGLASARVPGEIKEAKVFARRGNGRLVLTLQFERADHDAVGSGVWRLEVVRQRTPGAIFASSSGSHRRVDTQTIAARTSQQVQFDRATRRWAISADNRERSPSSVERRSRLVRAF